MMLPSQITKENFEQVVRHTHDNHIVKDEQGHRLTMMILAMCDPEELEEVRSHLLLTHQLIKERYAKVREHNAAEEQLINELIVMRDGAKRAEE
jgi:hypothetical protein